MTMCSNHDIDLDYFNLLSDPLQRLCAEVRWICEPFDIVDTGKGKEAGMGPQHKACQDYKPAVLNYSPGGGTVV